MRSLAFAKYEGLGNDFVVLDAADELAFDPRRAPALCDRRLGIGADGVLLVLPSGRPGVDARMKVINADGSVPEMCGNGLRCAALHVARGREMRAGELAFDTDAGLRRCTIDDRGPVPLVTVDMGIVRVVGERTISVSGDAWDLVLADAGNPHAITFRPATRSTVERVGPAISTDAAFPRGTNVEFAALAEDGIDLVVWERGVGVTHACGTGACATVAVACAKGLLPVGREVSVRLPGGALAVTIHAEGRAVMRGPARLVFCGEIALPEASA